MTLSTSSCAVRRLGLVRLCCENLFIIIVLLGLFSTQATAASFDCKKAASWVEKTVCSDPELSKLDEEMAKAYHDALASLSPEGQKEIKQYQKKWLKDISSYRKAKLKLHFNDEDKYRKAEHVLKLAYEERIEVLKQILIKFPGRIFRNVHIDHSESDKACGDVDKGLMYPQIENPRDENEKFWNSLMSQKAIDKFRGEESEECTDISDVYTVSFSNNHLISCDNQDHWYQHGANQGLSGGTFLNWLLEARRELRTSDLFDDKTDWRNKLTELVTHKKEEQQIADSTTYIVDGDNLKTDLIDVIDKIEWLISKDGLVFRLYPWNYSHSILMTIDWKTLDPYLSKNGSFLIY